MNTLEKIFLTWALFEIPVSLCGWMLDDVEHPILWNLLCMFMYLPLVIGALGLFIYAAIGIWS